MAERLSLEGRLAVVTGGGRGIGRAVAVALAREGCNVIITGRDPQSLESTLAELSRSSRAGIMALKCDVTNAADVEAVFAAAAKKRPTLDILVNNAGIAHSLAPADQITVETWRRVIDTNLTGTFLCTHAALPLMRAGATIVNNISVAASEAFENMSAYIASKAGALGFTNALRVDLRKRGIRVLALVPGATDTGIWDQFWPNAPREKMLKAETVAEAVLHAVTLPPEATIEEIRLGPSAGPVS